MCKCKTVKGPQCKNKELPNSLFCRVHQKCEKTVAVAKASKVSKTKKPAVAKASKVSKTKSSKKTNPAGKTYLTGSRDTDILVLRSLPPDELRRVCNLNKTLQKICKENIQIRNRLLKEEPAIIEKIRRSLDAGAPYQYRLWSLSHTKKGLYIQIRIYADAYSDIEDLIIERIKNITGNAKIVSRPTIYNQYDTYRETLNIFVPLDAENLKQNV